MKFFKKILCAIFASVLAIMLVACGEKVPDNLNDGVGKMENEGYEVTKLTADDVTDLFGGFTLEIKTAMECERETDEKYLIVFWFEDEDSAKNFQGFLNLIEDDLEKALNTSKDEEKMEFSVKRKDNTVYCGTKNACKDFEK